MRRKTILIFFALLSVTGTLLILFASPSKKSPSSDCAHLRVNLSEGDPPSLHPHLGFDIRGRILGKALFEGLTRMLANGGAVPAAAERIEIDATGTRYTFSIRPHLWSNGDPVTAHHFEHSWKQAIHPNSLCARADLFYLIKNAKRAKCKEVALDEVAIKAVDDHTLTVELENPAPYFLQLISHPIFSPLCKEEKEPSAFNGPFTVKKWEKGSVLELEKNPSYWDKESVSLDLISIFMIPDVYTEFALFEKKELDIMGDCFDSIPLDILSTVMTSPQFKTKEISSIYWLYTNVTKPPFNSDKMRKAFAYALDREDLTKNFLIGDYPCHTILPRTLSLIEKSSESPQRAVELFEEGLKELGLTRETFPVITLSYCPYGNQKSLSEVLQQKWRSALGVEVQIQSYEWNVLADHFVHGQFELGSCGRTAVFEDPLYYLEIFKERENSYNYSRWENEEYKNLLNFAVQCVDDQARKQYLQKAEQLLFQEMPVIPLFTETCKYLTREDLKGYFINGSGYVDFKPVSFNLSRQ